MQFDPQAAERLAEQLENRTIHPDSLRIEVRQAAVTIRAAIRAEKAMHDRWAAEHAEVLRLRERVRELEEAMVKGAEWDDKRQVAYERVLDQRDEALATAENLKVMLEACGSELDKARKAVEAAREYHDTYLDNRWPSIEPLTEALQEYDNAV